MIEYGHALRRWRWRAAGLLAVAVFMLLAGRFWHPFYGFTRFVQLDEAGAAAAIPGIRARPVFVYDRFNGYDGALYTQIAFHPLLDSPELQRALGNVPYRARRILGSALAWLIAGGNPARIANTYAALNLAVWFGLAVLLWRVLAVSTARSFVAWLGVMFSAGALHSVRLALTDLLAATLMAAALALAERGRATGGLATLAAAGLARETALAAVVGLWRKAGNPVRTITANALKTALVTLPLVAWMVYVRWKAGPADQGFGNFAWPMVDWIEKGSATLADFVREPNFRWLNTTTLLAFLGLTTQAGYFLRRWRWADPWWRAGASGVALMAVLGTSVWEGHPGAATRVLLPMGVAFAVLATREAARWPWIIGGGLTVFSGVLALWHVHEAPHELNAGTFSRGAYLTRVETGWHGIEREGGGAWAWCANRGSLTVETAPAVTRPVEVRIKLRAITPRQLEVHDGTSIVWRGLVAQRTHVISFSAVPASSGQLCLQLGSDAAPVRENEQPETRGLGFAVYSVELE